MTALNGEPKRSLSSPRLVLASASPRRLALLRQVGIEPDQVIEPAVNETPGKAELPRDLARRLAAAKADAARLALGADEGDDLALAADTVVAVGRRILPKAETADEARACLRCSQAALTASTRPSPLRLRRGRFASVWSRRGYGSSAYRGPTRMRISRRVNGAARQADMPSRVWRAPLC